MKDKMLRHLAEQVRACLFRINELTPKDEIQILVPSVEDILLEAQMLHTKPKEKKV